MGSWEQVYSDKHITVITMAASAIVIFDIFVLMYNLAWLGFLTYKHYGQVTTKAGHIFELNVLFNYILYTFFIFILTDFEALPSGKMTDILHTTISYSYLAALAGSQIETVIFLKNLNLNTMMTNTAGKIILMMTICSFGIALMITFVMPSPWKVDEICEYFKPEAFYRSTLPTTVVLVINLAVIGFAVFRSRQFRKTRDNEEMFGVEGPGQEIEVELRNHLNGTPPQDRLFTIQQGVMSTMSRESEHNHETPLANVEDDIIVEDIELVDLETNVMIPNFDEKRKVTSGNVEDDIVVVESEVVHLETNVMSRDFDEKRKETSRNCNDDMKTNTDLLSISAMIDQVSQLEEVNLETQCLPGLGLMQTLNKYLKNALISLLLVTSELPWNLIALYAFFTRSGCENPTLSVLSEITLYSLPFIYLFFPFLIKIKLDRLSE